MAPTIAPTPTAGAGFSALWDLPGLVIQCITLSTRPERRRAAQAQFDAVGLGGRVRWLEQTPDIEDGKRGCFHGHQRAARAALELDARMALTFEDDVVFLPHFAPSCAGRVAAFLRAPAAADWQVFFLGHFPRKMELTGQPDAVKVRSMDGQAYFLSRAGMEALCELEYAGEQVDVHFHYRCERAYALYPMVAVQAAGHSDTEAGLERAPDWNDDKLTRERELYEGCVKRKAVAAAVAMMGGLGVG
jgi:hypothetical protein